ncbi:efflux RND transporter permease subunit, partial [Stenotrophomonas sp. SrG]|uniref:efflux RND transporter permease subunit n=1 Tax=Stenotrophomonas sp. SrG TaxID=3414430 RepID=UPI003CEC809D
LCVRGGTSNLVSQSGIVLLVGLAAETGSLIGEFGTQLRDGGRDVHRAIGVAAWVRLRPGVMTSRGTGGGALARVGGGG